MIDPTCDSLMTMMLGTFADTRLPGARAVLGELPVQISRLFKLRPSVFLL